MIQKYDFYKTKYGRELLVDLIKLEDLEKYLCLPESHYLTYYDITIFTDASGHLFINNYKCTLEKNSIAFSSPGQVRKWECKTTPKGFVILFEEEFLCSFFNDLKFVQKLSYFSNTILNPYIQISKEEFSFLNNLIIGLEEEMHTDLTDDNHMLRAILYQILIWLDRIYCAVFKEPKRITSSNYVSDFINLVKDNFQADHSVSSYASKLNITAGHLNDIVKNNLKITAKKYIQNRIIIEAKRLINYTDLSIIEIAWKLNFQDLSYFIRFFKKMTGLTPLQFRKENP
ncbi:helix-turn-helix domain-containing protein [Bacteroidota bacterium]